MIYIDVNTFHCYVAQDDNETRVPYEEPFFDNKCVEFVEGYCCVPEGYSYINSNGTVYRGGMIFPWKDHKELSMVQRDYERNLLAEYESALSNIEAALGV